MITHEMNNSYELGSRIAKLRNLKGWTQTQLAEEMRLPLSRIAMIETGERSIKAEDLWQWAYVLESSVYYLITGIDIDKGYILPEKLGMSNETITRLQGMSERERLCCETLVMDPIFLEAFTAYVYGDDISIDVNGERHKIPYDDAIKYVLPSGKTLARITESAFASRLTREIMRLKNRIVFHNVKK